VRSRIVVVAGGVAVLLLMVALRIVELTLTDSPDLARRARRQHHERIQVPARRGVIVDRHGETLASSVESPSIYAHPRRIADRARAQVVLARALGLPPRTVAEKLARNAPFVWLKRTVTPVERDAVRALALEGVGEVSEARRFYPHGGAAAHVLGSAGVDMLGLDGIELSYEEDLRALPRMLDIERDALGREILTEGGITDPRVLDGARVQLTLDTALQTIAERALEEGVRQARARAGIAIVLEPSTGEVLALANCPGFDPNERPAANLSRRRNRAVSDFYEPGSTFKPLLVAAALEDGVVRPDEIVFCENGQMPIGGWVVHDHGRHAWLTVSEIIQVSSNIGAAKIGERLGRERFHDFLARFGLGQPTGIDLPGEVGGMLRGARDWSRATLATVSFGQGVAMTPLQMARAYAAIANGGLLLTPYVGARAVGSDGGVLWEHRPTVVRRVMRPETAAAVTAMLEGVLEEGGTGTLARVDGFRVAGKTGTAQKVEEGSGRYSPTARIASFVGFLPAQAPRVVILTLVDEPETSPYGGIVAAPIFRAIAAGAMERLGLAAPPRAEPFQEAALDAPPAPAPAPAGVPSFIGLSKRDAVARARALGWTVQVNGWGYVQSQVPPPGAAAAPGKELVLMLAPSSDAL